LTCSVSFLSSWAIIASIDLTTSLLISFVCESLFGERADGLLDGLLRFVGLRLEFFSQQRVEFRCFNGSGLCLGRPVGIWGQP
jgi:hypothetical protein